MGCNSTCSYCIVPAVRGREQSRRPGDIIAEVTRLAHDGGREIQIKISDQPLRHLGSLNLPVEKVTFKFVDYREDEADKFLQDFLRPLER